MKREEGDGGWGRSRRRGRSGWGRDGAGDGGLVARVLVEDSEDSEKKKIKTAVLL